ncbi:hypothetical protein ACFFLZ_02305 [Photobacterium aphoticum]|uniref:Uncharacterized protein n=1 Tax=Photobacterium aphoticum TaxID=754436 RepID=A0A0J1GTN3_9GAMM|nr:hypothetical protein [Photobacterium aphoticum]KLV03026.1 hypothetical protein ABT58_00365 [Photobacterium aphoticum]PSU57857.1 hypothetical protein C9I90_08270 [Photobacterium aphoticum]GHA60570.1 hypothetical protein GCM10007086_38000 [Photobacterium aphoticum]
MNIQPPSGSLFHEFIAQYTMLKSFTLNFTATIVAVIIGFVTMMPLERVGAISDTADINAISGLLALSVFFLSGNASFRGFKEVMA